MRKRFKKWENSSLDSHKYPTSLGQAVRRKSGTCEPCQCYDSAAWRPPGNVLPTFSDHLGGLHILFSSSREREVGKAGSGVVCEPQIVRTLRKWGVVGLTHAFPGRRALGISHEQGIWEPVSFSHVLHALNDFFIQSMGTPKAFTTCTVVYTSKDEWIQWSKHYSALHKYSPQLIMWPWPYDGNLLQQDSFRAFTPTVVNTYASTRFIFFICK